MRPIKTNESNFVYLGPTPEIADLHCRTEGMDTFSVWELSPEERQLVAEGGQIRLGIHGMRPIPPVSLQVVPNAGPFEKLPLRCDLCCLPSDHAIHGSGENTHAFRARREP